MSTAAVARERALGALLQAGGERAAALVRRPAGHRMLLAALPTAIMRRFDTAAATDLTATLELAVRDPAGGEPTRFELAVDRGRLTVTRRRGGRSRASASVLIGGEDMIRLVSGSAAWPQLISSGRMQLSGDPFLALRFPSVMRMTHPRGSLQPRR